MASPLSAVAAVVLAGLTACTASHPAAVRVEAGPQASRVAAGYHFDATGVSPVTRKQLGKSWHRGCPVPPRDLRALRVRYWGFDRLRHSGVLIVNVAAVPAVRAAFADIARARFPIRRIEPISNYAGSDNKSMAHDNTSAFNCRYAVSSGPKSWSEHAYGEAVDIDPRENPYTLNGRVYPPSGARYVDRSHHRRGMIFAQGPVVGAFDAVRWGWGGRWSSSPDYQHFSVNGR